MFSDLLCKLDAADRDCCRVESFESEHRSNPVFDAAMILLHHIIQVLAGSYSNALRHRSRCFQFGDGPMRSRVSVQGNEAVSGGSSSLREKSVWLRLHRGVRSAE